MSDSTIERTRRAVAEARRHVEGLERELGRRLGDLRVELTAARELRNQFQSTETTLARLEEQAAELTRTQ